jgi:hypothetical protein
MRIPQSRGDQLKVRNMIKEVLSLGGEHALQQALGRFLSGLVYFRIVMKAKSWKTLKLGNTLEINY